MSTETTKTRTRRPNARPAEIVIGAMGEHFHILEQRGDLSEGIKIHVARLRDLLDELRRATNGKESEE